MALWMCCCDLCTKDGTFYCRPEQEKISTDPGYREPLAQVWWFGGLFGGFLGPEDSMMLVIPTANWNSAGDVMA